MQAFHVPGPPLSDFVAMLWLFDGPGKPHAYERVLPTGTTELVINLREDVGRVYDRDDIGRCRTVRGPLVCGPHSEFFVIDTAQQMSVLGVHFKAGGAAPFFGPASELHGAHLALDDIWGRSAGELYCRLLEAPTPAEKFRVLEETLLARAVRRLGRHPAVAFAVQEIARAPDTIRISDIVGRVGLSSRRFSQVFQEEVGLLPKVFGRVQRFQQVLARLSTSRSIDWSSAALSCGYYDQAHFIRDFRAFTGLAPTAWARVRGVDLNHVPLDVAPVRTAFEAAG